MLAPAPLKRDFTPSLATIWRAASMDDLYLTAWKHCQLVINRTVNGRIFITNLTRRHHHATTDRVERVRSDTSGSRDSPAESEGSQEVTLEGTDKDDRLDGVVETEVETTVDDDTRDRGHETTVETGDTVGGESLLVDINQTVELALTTLLRILGVVGQTGTGVVEGVDEQQRSGTGSLDSTSVSPPLAIV